MNRRILVRIVTSVGALVALSACTPIQWTTAPIDFGVPPAPQVNTPRCDPYPLGWSDYSESIGGWARTWHVYTPNSVCQPEGNGFRKIPMVLALHGANEFWPAFRDATGLAAAAASDGFIAVFPDGYQGSWNDGRANVTSTAHQQNIGDVAFLVTLVDRIVATGMVDARKVHALGFSNGAMMANRLACDRADKVTAIAVVAGFGPGDPALNAICQPDRATAVLSIHSQNDPIVPYSGGPIQPAGQRGVGASAATFFALWSARNGCSGAGTPVPISGTAVNAGAQRFVYTGCSAALEHDRMTHASHEWFGAPGANEFSYSATVRAWNFLRTKSR